MARLCQIRVTASGLYCCDVGHLKIRPDCIGVISYANLPETTLEYEVTPGVWAPADPIVLSGTGTETLIKPGEYRFGIDCEALRGTEAPEDPAEQIGFCYDDCKVDDWGPILSAQLESLCDKLVAGNDPAAMAEVIAQLELLCAKLLEQTTQNAEILAELSAICDKLLQSNESLQALCDKLEAGFADMLTALAELKQCNTEENQALLECLEDIKELLICEPEADLGVLASFDGLRAA